MRGWTEIWQMIKRSLFYFKFCYKQPITWIIYLLIDFGKPGFIWRKQIVLLRKNFLNFSLLDSTKDFLLQGPVPMNNKYVFYKLSILVAKRIQDINFIPLFLFMTLKLIIQLESYFVSQTYTTLGYMTRFYIFIISELKLKIYVVFLNLMRQLMQNSRLG